MNIGTKIFTVFFFFNFCACAAYTHTISNQTSGRIAVKFIYEGECQSNNRFSPLEIDPETTRSFETECPLENIVASMVTGYDNDTMLRSAARWYPEKEFFKGNGTWIMSELNDCHILNGLRMCKFEIRKLK